MFEKPTYEELEERVRVLEAELVQRESVESALRQSEEHCKLNFEQAVDAIFWADPDTGLITNCNMAAERLLEKKKTEIIGQNQTALHPPDKADFYRDLFRSHIEESGSVDDEAEVITGSGELIPVHITASITLVRGKRIIQGIFRDITHRKRAEEELRQEKNKYSILVENSLTGIYIDQNKTIAFANNRFAEIYGYSKDELTGMASWKLVHPEDRALTDEVRARRLSGEDAPSEYRARGLTKKGRTIWIKRRNTRIDYMGQPAILGNVVDITRQIEAEEELRKTNEALQNFVDVASHDLKTPIISIEGFSYRLLKKYHDVLGEKGREYVQQIRGSVHRMEALVSDLLALSRTGQVVSAFREVDSAEVVNKVASALEDRLMKKDVRLVVAENLPVVWCDPERMFQVFENLLVNAIKYSDDARQPRIEIGYEDWDQFHQFHVKDNGIGIEPQFHRKIFDMFHRLKQKEGEDGTGLGLSIVERIVQNHGGKVWVESDKGKGTTFCFTLPKRRE